LELEWAVEVDHFQYREVSLQNVLASKGSGPPLLIGAHYDTRRVADLDPDPGQRGQPITGANDGASGVAVLLELARVLDVDRLPYEVVLTFFDAEDQGGSAGWEWFVGSSRVAEQMAADHREDFAGLVLLDMIGDLDQRVCRAADSTQSIADPLFAAATQLGYAQWLPSECRYHVSDDHTPFLNRGLPAVDLIDFDYQYWHTLADKCDKIGPEPLQRVGSTVELWLEQGAPGAGSTSIADTTD
jgi:Zn-dependent M28 family amino/carboxypeptidase